MKVNITYNGGLKNIADMLENSMESIILSAGESVKNSAQSMCPVDTGKLRDSISVSAEGNKAVISANTDYAAYVEFGTSKMPPKPFLVPSLIGNSDAILKAIGEMI